MQYYFDNIKEFEEAFKEYYPLAPLFHLNDLRVCFAHLLPEEQIQKYKNNIVKAYGLNDFSEYRKIYDSLIGELYELYKYLNVVDFSDILNKVKLLEEVD